MPMKPDAAARRFTTTRRDYRAREWLARFEPDELVESPPAMVVALCLAGAHTIYCSHYYEAEAIGCGPLRDATEATHAL